jgi:VanZ family protein
MSLRNLWPALAWAVVILVLSGIPGDYIPHVLNFSDWLKPDKLVHLAVFAILAVLLMRGISAGGLRFGAQKFAGLIVLSVGTVFGGITELLQYYLFIGRSGNVFDLMADIAGLMAGIAVYLIFFKRQGQKVKNI